VLEKLIEQMITKYPVSNEVLVDLLNNAILNRVPHNKSDPRVQKIINLARRAARIVHIESQLNYDRNYYSSIERISGSSVHHWMNIRYLMIKIM